jgi:cystathionine beta-lyase
MGTFNPDHPDRPDRPDRNNSFDFDRKIERHGTDSLKYDYATKQGLTADVLPLWVADMDFAAPPAVQDALAKKCQQGVFGYSVPPGADYFSALAGWYADRFDWRIEPEWLVLTPSVVFALCAAIRSLTEPGDAVLIQEPVYPPFRSSVLENGRTLVVNQLLEQNGHYRLDLDDFERQIRDHQVRLFILCSPHNPVGRVWTAEELNALGEICLKHDVIIVSDEIHADFVFGGRRHLVFQDLQPAFADRTITCTAPTKTFNIAGLQISNILIANPEIREKFRREVHCSGYSLPNALGLAACRGAYQSGGPWLDSLLDYIAGNFARLRQVLDSELPMLRLVEPEGTYLAWLDCRGLNLTDPELKRLINDKAKLWLSDGCAFGAGGEGFQRINLACPRSTLDEALDRLVRAIHSLDSSHRPDES